MSEESSATEGPRAREDIVFRPLAHEWVLYDPKTRQLHVLNAAAAVVWQLCDGATGPDAMARELEEVLPEAPPPDQVRSHVDEILDRFTTEGLLA